MAQVKVLMEVDEVLIARWVGRREGEVKAAAPFVPWPGFEISTGTHGLLAQHFHVAYSTAAILREITIDQLKQCTSRLERMRRWLTQDRCRASLGLGRSHVHSSSNGPMAAWGATRMLAARLRPLTEVTNGPMQKTRTARPTRTPA